MPTTTPQQLAWKTLRAIVEIIQQASEDAEGVYDSEACADIDLDAFDRIVEIVVAAGFLKEKADA